MLERRVEYAWSGPDFQRLAARRGRWVAALGTACVHGAFFGLIALLGFQGQRTATRSTPATQMVEVVTAPEPAPPPEAAPEPEAAPTAASKPSQRAERRAPAPAAAQAGKVIAADEQAADFGDTFVVGQAETYGGGMVSSHGTAKRVYDRRASDTGVQGSTGTEPLGDASRPPSLAGGANWDCPFPAEADDIQLNHALVGLRVEVAADGSVQQVQATSDPGHGFAREARLCAQNKRWSPGLDRAGRPTRAVALVHVRFDR